MPTWKSNTLVFLKYNNYYNRIVKREDDFLNYLNYELFRITATNFNPNDGVNTEHIVNMEDGMYPDYMVVFDEASQLVSRWFVVETNRIRGGQYKVTLHRDTVADYYNDIMSAPCFIEKATLNANDPLVFNEEDMTFNQIKTKETLLKDESNSAWIVGYYSKKIGDTSVLKGSISYNKNINLPYKTVPYENIENWPFFQYTEDNPLKAPSLNSTYNILAKQSTGVVDKYSINAENGNTIIMAQISPNSTPTLIIKEKVPNNIPVQTAAIEFGLDNLRDHLNDFLLDKAVTTEEYLDFLTFANGDLIKTEDNRYYELTITALDNSTSNYNITAGSLFEDLKTIVINSNAFTGNPNASSFSVTVPFKNYIVSTRERTDLEITYDISGEKLVTEDAPYNIFAIPYSDIIQVRYKIGNSYQFFNMSKDIGLATASTLIENLGENLYDIQLLPYCPVQELILFGGRVNGENPIQASPVIDNTEEDETKKIKGFIFHVPKSQFTFNIVEPIEINQTAIDQKISNQCDKYRLCSPNFNSYFDFSPAKNGGVRYFNVDCCYKPFQPYIHINPDFGGLYGEDFNDPRGLICSGDFSLTQIKDQWQNYQIQNKNFQEIFNRQIENMEVQNKYQRQQDMWTAFAGTIGGGVSGAATGLLASGGNPLVAGITGAAGTLTSALGGIADVNINQALRNEAIDYTKDNFGYQLGNIQALPNILTKVSSLNNNNKIFPILEYYTCTDREKQAFRDKLKYNGMTVMVIGAIGDYIRNELSYIKGKIIRLPEINEDYHLANEIAREINLGIYI